MGKFYLSQFNSLVMRRSRIKSGFQGKASEFLPSPEPARERVKLGPEPENTVLDFRNGEVFMAPHHDRVQNSGTHFAGSDPKPLALHAADSALIDNPCDQIVSRLKYSLLTDTKIRPLREKRLVDLPATSFH